jgi:hypothetical protein
MDSLKLEQMIALVARILACEGYHAERGTTLMVEHGTAAIPAWMESMLSDLSGGKIRVQRGGIEGHPAHVGQYAGRGKGNYRFKAALESLGSLIHSEFAFLPGQTGLSVERRPEETHGLLKANDALLEAFLALREARPELAAALRFPVMSSAQHLEIALEVYHRINTRTEHELEGWDLRVVPDERNPMRMRRQSPWEVWQPGRAQLTRFTDQQIAVLLYSEQRIKLRTVQRAMIAFEDAEMGSGLHRFDAHHFADGEKFGTILNPFAEDSLYLYDASGRYRGVARKLQRVCRTDDEAMHREMGRVSKVLNQRLDPVRQLGREIAGQRIADARHNAEVIAQACERKTNSIAARAARAGAVAAETYLPAADAAGDATRTVDEHVESVTLGGMEAPEVYDEIIHT